MRRLKGKKSRPRLRTISISSSSSATDSNAANAMPAAAAAAAEEDQSQSQSQSQSQESGLQDIQTQPIPEGEDSIMLDLPVHDSNPPSQEEEPHPMPASPTNDSADPCPQPDESQGMNTSRPPSPLPAAPAHDSESLSHHHHQEGEEEDDDDDEETQVVSSFPPPPALPAHDSNHPPAAARRAGGKRKKPTKRQMAAMQKKLRVLAENLQPIPFRPVKTLDFSAHELLFRTLGLWDFAHIEFDHHIRSDLLALLIANYNPSNRCSFVKSCRVKVNRTDLGRALKLPVKKDKASVLDGSVSEQQGFSEQSISVIGEFLSNYVLLHEDTWMMPDEILVYERLLKDGQLQKIDWAGMIWFMVEKEISQLQESGSYYYASHLQHLMKVQKPELFLEVEKGVEEVSVEDEDDAVTAVAMQEQDLDNQRVELSLGNDRNGGDQAGEGCVMDFQESKEENEQWFLDGRNNGNEHCLRHCNLNDIRSSGCGRESRADEDDGYGPSSRFSNLSRLASTDLLQDMEAANGSYVIHADILDPSSGELLRADMHKSNHQLNSSGLSIFDVGCKQESDDEDDVHHLSQDDHHRKIRNDGSWGSHSTLNFRMCMGQMQSGMEKATMMYEEKMQECNQARMQVQFLNNELQHRNDFLCSLQKDMNEMQNKKDMEIFRLERELFVMTQLLEGYKKALKSIRSAFAEYRERHHVPCEPIYKDVVGCGGLVLSSSELEKRQLEKEEEDRRMRFVIEEKVVGLERDWLAKFELHLRKVDSLNQKILVAKDEIKLLKENAKRGIPVAE